MRQEPCNYWSLDTHFYGTKGRNKHRLLCLVEIKYNFWGDDCVPIGHTQLAFVIYQSFMLYFSLQWRHHERDGVSNHRLLDRLLSCLLRRRSKKISKLRLTGICEGNPSVTGGFLSQRASNAKNVSIWWRHHVFGSLDLIFMMIFVLII